MGRKFKYSYDFKVRCVEDVLESNRSVNSVAQENNFEKTSLRR
ncbi:transposase, partial [Flavobacterium chungangense]